MPDFSILAVRVTALLSAGCLASAITIGATQAATLSATIGVTNLTRAQEKRLEALACLPHGVGMYAAEGAGYAKGNDFKMTMVNVRCAAHRHIERHPVAYEVYCRRDVPGKWDCARAEEKLFVRVDGAIYNVGANQDAVPVEEAYRIFRYLISAGELPHIAQSKPFGHREEREITFAVWKDEGDRIFAHCDHYLVLTRLGPGKYRLEPEWIAAQAP